MQQLDVRLRAARGRRFIRNRWIDDQRAAIAVVGQNEVARYIGALEIDLHRSLAVADGERPAVAAIGLRITFLRLGEVNAPEVNDIRARSRAISGKSDDVSGKRRRACRLSEHVCGITGNCQNSGPQAVC